MRWGSLTTVGFVAISVYAFNHLFSLYDSPPGVFGNYPQPGLLLFKLDIFLAGICLAYQHREREPSRKLYWIVLAVVCLFRATIQVKGLALGTICLIELDKNKMDLVHRILSSKWGKFAGDTSYAVYLLHLLLMYPMLCVLLGVSWMHAQPKTVQFFIALFVIGIPLYGLAAVVHQFVELPGIALGKRIIRLAEPYWWRFRTSFPPTAKPSTDSIKVSSGGLTTD